MTATRSTGEGGAGPWARTGLPGRWGQRWASPAAEDRPLQIVHGIEPSQPLAELVRAQRERGLGGVVCNVSFRDYLCSEENWGALVAAIDECQRQHHLNAM